MKHKYMLGICLLLAFVVLSERSLGDEKKKLDSCRKLVAKWKQGKISSKTLEKILSESLAKARNKDFLKILTYFFAQENEKLTEIVFEEIYKNYWEHFNKKILKARPFQQLHFLNALSLLSLPDRWKSLQDEVRSIVEKKLVKFFPRCSDRKLIPTLGRLLRPYGTEVREFILETFYKSQRGRLQNIFKNFDVTTKRQFLSLLCGSEQVRFLPLIIEILSEGDRSLQELSLRLISTWKNELGDDKEDVVYTIISLVEKERAKENPNYYFVSQICLTLGNLRDVSAISVFLDVLDKDKGVARSTALWALRDMTGLRLGANSLQWKRWWGEENTIYENIVLSDPSPLESLNLNECYEAVRAVGKLRLRKQEAAECLLPLLEHENGLIRKETCCALKKLGAFVAVSPLISSLEEEKSAEVRKQAWGTLKQITGQDLPPVVEEWENWYVAQK